MWTQKQLKQHRLAADMLEAIMLSAFDYIRFSNHREISEHKIQDFILDKFKNSGLKTDKKYVIVAFGRNSAIPHYYPKKNSSILKKNSLVLIDIWARLDMPKAPFADITWVAFYGDKVPADISRVYAVVKKARDAVISYLKQELSYTRVPAGKSIDKVARDMIDRHGFKGKFIHSTGHSLGTCSPHGRLGHLRKTNPKPLAQGIGYALEPGIYLKNKFGIRSEMNFFLSKDKTLVLTTRLQHKLLKI